MTTGCTRNGFGHRLSQFKNGVTTHYTLDLNAGLTQVLQDGTNTYLYGVNRIAQVAETQTGYFLPDALGSVRQMTDAYGNITLTQSYAPYGEVLYSEGTAATDYAFTGESYDPQTGLVYLRARYYSPGDSRFISRDTWAGDVNTPMSYNLWAYGYDNPVIYSDPSGKFPIYCGSLKTKEQYEMCVLDYYGYEKSDSPTRLDNISGTSGCYHGPIEYRAEGYLEGTGAYLSQIYSGNERVYDFATMRALNFSFTGTSLVFDNLGLTAGVQAYIGNVEGFRDKGTLEVEYSGPTVSIFGGGSVEIPVGPGLGISVSHYQSTVDRTIRGTTVNVGVSASIIDILPMLDGGYSLVQYEAITNAATGGNYVTPDGRKIQKGKLILDIGFGFNSPIKPWHYGIILINSAISMGRSYGITKALKFAADYEDIHAQE